jgi:hypothetical protein
LATGELIESFTGEYGQITESVFLNVRQYDGRWYGLMEFSPSAYLRGHNLWPATVAETTRVLTELYSRCEDYVVWTVGVDDIEVTRLDIVRQFHGVSDISTILDAVSVTTGSRLSINSQHRNPSTARSETVMRGVKNRWTAKLYDKQAQMLDLAKSAAPERRTGVAEAAAEAQGVVRYEAQLRRPALKDMNITTMAHVHRKEGTLQDKARDLFDRCQFGTEAGGQDKVRAALRRMRSNAADYKRADKVIGMLWQEAHGEPLSCKADAQAENRRVARRYGLTAADMLTPTGNAVRLHYPTATQVGRQVEQ